MAGTIQSVLRTALQNSENLLITAAMSLPGTDASTRPDIERLMTAFERVLVDALDGNPEQRAREIFLETVVPALVAYGQTSGEAIFGSVRFGIVGSHALITRVPANRRAEAAIWLGDFFASYVKDLAARVAAEQRS